MTTTFTAGILGSLASWDDPAGAWVAYNTALAGMYETVYGIVSDQGSPDEQGFTAGWSTLLDPDACPTEFLPYLGMFVGVFVPPGTDDATARALVKAESGFQRGTPGAIVSAVTRNLRPPQTVVLQERTGADGSSDPYHFVIVVPPEQVIDIDVLVAAVTSAKPAGILFTVVQSSDWLWDEATHTWNADTMTWNQAATQQP